MTHDFTRRTFLGLIPVACVPYAYTQTPTKPSLLATYPAQDPVLVQATVGASHRDLNKVKELVERSPALAKAAWDWGYGDWETALGPPRIPVRERLPSTSLRMERGPISSLSSCLGKLEAVKAMVTAYPGVQRTLRPHGITMLATLAMPEMKPNLYLNTLSPSATRIRSPRV